MKGSNRGFLKMIILVIIAILILSYFGFNLKDIAESDTSKSNFSYIWNFLSYVWNTFLVTPASFVWNVIVVGIFWDKLVLPMIALLETVARN
ncbi:MAG: hypothetical protein AAB391_00710 [Patescibacteria group bacterium]